jgi:hypothetical protein
MGCDQFMETAMRLIASSKLRGDGIDSAPLAFPIAMPTMAADELEPEKSGQNPTDSSYRNSLVFSSTWTSKND